ncbi:MAG: sigma-54 dependent transcriptional regulator [Candidatus Eisenbacteria bacterium]|uniref:Sigma-54-dependent Fis family transcriptional regulator n=1 Tax=Eiseniibacteriota bacterium TaxID=2212470 RepID=A0A956RQW2_UNCEI|nr:sigma-54-dependent Fis family transcriptional regulator [Candidatus Eisenbacteria bacterium]
MARVLLVDDDASLREVLTFALEEIGHDVEAHGDGASALAAITSSPPEIVITDLKMPGLDGMEVLRRVHTAHPAIPVIVLTAFGTIEDAVEAMKEGAYHYLTKPYRRDELRVTIDQALERRRLLLENQSLRDRLRAHQQAIEIVHASPAMERVVDLIGRIAPTDATVLITGESGSGKEVVAKTLHAQSERWSEPFVAVNCAAIPRDLMESELFGHIRGAFTGAVKDKPGKFQQAQKGTLLLDEIAELSPELQTKLLRVLETREVDVIGGSRPLPIDVRVLAATNADLEVAVREGRFRSDLFYRLNVIPIHVPPLRERALDIPALWDVFLRKFAPNQPVRSTPELMQALMQRTWPGNVRELANTCQRMVLLRSSDTLSEADLPGTVSPPKPIASVGVPSTSSSQGDPTSSYESDRAEFLGTLPDDSLPLRDVEREIIVRALAKHGGNRSRTAEYLRIPRHVLLYRLAKFGIS